MINRINLILQAKNITARQFAEEIGIQPSGMSHILGGRNNPSLDFVVKVLKRYPEIDAGWLLLGKGAMYGNGERLAVSGQQLAVNDQQPAVSGQQTAFGGQQLSFGEEEEPEPTPKVEDYEATYIAVPPREVEQQAAVSGQQSAVNSQQSVVSSQWAADSGQQPVRMLLIYSDNTYEVLTPRI